MTPTKTALLTLAALAITACTKPEPPNIGYAPYDKGYQSKMDLAQVDYKYPIPPAQLSKITRTTWPNSIRNSSTSSTAASLPGPSRTARSTAASCCRAAKAASSG